MDKKKRLKKIQSLKKQKEKHLQKIREYKGPKYTLKPYWEKQITEFERQIQEEEKKRKKKK